MTEDEIEWDEHKMGMDGDGMVQNRTEPKKIEQKMRQGESLDN